MKYKKVQDEMSGDERTRRWENGKFIIYRVERWDTSLFNGRSKVYDSLYEVFEKIGDPKPLARYSTLAEAKKYI